MDVIFQQQVRLQSVNMEGNKLLIRGEAPSPDAKNTVWNQIKLVDAGSSDLIADISVKQEPRDPEFLTATCCEQEATRRKLDGLGS